MVPLVDLFDSFRKAASEDDANLTARRIVQVVRPRVWSIIVQGTRIEAVEDVLQDFWKALFSGLHQFRGSSESEAWKLCFVIARRCSINWLRRKSKVEEVSLDLEEIRQAVEASVLVVPMSAGERLDIEKALSLIEATHPDDARYIVLRHLEGQSFDEIGRSYGMTAAAVRTRIERALEKSRATLTERKPYV